MSGTDVGVEYSPSGDVLHPHSMILLSFRYPYLLVVNNIRQIHVPPVVHDCARINLSRVADYKAFCSRLLGAFESRVSTPRKGEARIRKRVDGANRACMGRILVNLLENQKAPSGITAMASTISWTANISVI